MSRKGEGVCAHVVDVRGFLRRFSMARIDTQKDEDKGRISTIQKCIAGIRSFYPSLFEAEKRVADFVLSRSEDVINMSISEVADLSKVADSTVVRFCQDLGYRGFQDFKIHLAKDLVPFENIIHEDISREDDVPSIVKKIFNSDMTALSDTLALLDMTEFEKAVDAIAAAKKVEFYGLGNSASVGMDASYRFLQIGVSSKAVVDAHVQVVSAGLLNEEDVAVGISHTGESKETVKAMRYAKLSGATTIGITSFLRSHITLYKSQCYSKPYRYQKRHAGRNSFELHATF
jgi:RpiR family carbohydrate utilization transcriptional regulator